MPSKWCHNTCSYKMLIFSWTKVKECAEKAEISAIPGGGAASAAAKPAATATTSTDGGKKEAPAKKPAQKQAKPAADTAKPASSGGVSFVLTKSHHVTLLKAHTDLIHWWEIFEGEHNLSSVGGTCLPPLWPRFESPSLNKVCLFFSWIRTYCSAQLGFLCSIKKEIVCQKHSPVLNTKLCQKPLLPVLLPNCWDDLVF